MPRRTLAEPPAPLSAVLRDLRLLGAVAAGYALCQLLLVVPGTGLGWDETVYVSQVSGRAPAAFFSAPRARGITWLVAPVAAVTSSVPVLRVWLAVLAAGGLLLSLWVWRPLLPVRVLALAGGLFAGLWTTLFYGPQAMPNLWVAFGALFTVGCFLRAARDPADRLAPAGIVAGVAFTALMRPGDAVWLVLPLLCATPALAPRRRALLVTVLVGGLVAGGAQWAVEAQLHYGGLLPRLRRASEIQGGLGWNPAFTDQLRSLDGRTLCRPCDVPSTRPVTALWWFALPPLTAGGLVAARRGGRWAPAALATGVAVSLAVPYLLMVGYAAPRFLLPAYALLAVPVALGLSRLFALGRGRPLALGALCAALVAHLVLQAGIADAAADRSRADRVAFSAVAAELRRLGVRPPCVLSGTEAVRAAYATGCAARQVYGGHDGSVTARELVALSGTRPTALLLPGRLRPPAWARHWAPHRLPEPPGQPGYRAYLAPAAPAYSGRRSSSVRPPHTP
ncbi:hypothetical protein BX286_0453 [Streptomyces sp. 3211.6]|uniref:hypothetical protein n=1 Tax=Streptomyces sp. 3211.6 TaxID=1938845 RepID=UPI000F1352FD|nr:hypothetical protein [Streptomyces sp. 3211.6]RKT02545.1 hypothetical protein BX286_0453 [Streptomyces sp. 3211.6]